MKAAELTNHFAPMDMVRSLSCVRAVRVGDKWLIAETVRKTDSSFGPPALILRLTEGFIV